MDRFEQRLDRFLARRFGMAEALARGLEEGILRLRQDFAAGRLELRQQLLARLFQRGDLLVEVLGIGTQRREFDLRRGQLGGGPS